MYHHYIPEPATTTTTGERPTQLSEGCGVTTILEDAAQIVSISSIARVFSSAANKSICNKWCRSGEYQHLDNLCYNDTSSSSSKSTVCIKCQQQAATLQLGNIQKSKEKLTNCPHKLSYKSIPSNHTSDQQVKQQKHQHQHHHNHQTTTTTNSQPIHFKRQQNKLSDLIIMLNNNKSIIAHERPPHSCTMIIVLISLTMAYSLLPATPLQFKPIILYANAQLQQPQQAQPLNQLRHLRTPSPLIQDNRSEQSSMMTRSKRFSSDYEQSFEVQPEATYYPHLGLDLRIRCIIRRRQGECSWLRNGRVVGQLRNKYEYSRTPDDGDCSILIRNVSMSTEDGTWQCQVTAQDIDHEPLISRELQVVVLVTPERPIIKNTVVNSQRFIVEEGNKPKIITCEIKGGNPPPNIEWFLDGRNITKEAVQFTTNATTSASRTTVSRLKMADVKRQMNGKNLTCSGWHPTLNQSTTVALDVHYIPTVSVSQREHSIVEGSPLSITCNVDSNPPPSIISWRLVTDGSTGGKLSSRVENSQQTITSPTRAGPLLEFNSISRDLNQNIFECLAQNSYGVSHPTDVKLNVLYAPVLLNTSHSESVSLGQRATLACIFEGNPEPEVKWFYTDPMSKYSQAFPLDNKSQYLIMQNVTYKQEGDYHCEAKNRINGYDYTVRSSNIILDVFGEPQFLVKSPIVVKAIQGSRADLTASFCSDPVPNKIYWQFGSIRLDVKIPSPPTDPQQQQQGSGSSAGNNGLTPQHLTHSSGANQKVAALAQRYQIHPLQSLQKRDSSFSKLATCFEAQLSILEPELTDQRDYQLIVQNERGQQSTLIRMRVSSPLSPILMLSSAFITIFLLFVCSLVAMFVIRKRKKQLEQQDDQHSSSNGTTTSVGQENINISLSHTHNNTAHGMKQNGKLGGAGALLGGQQLDSVVSSRRSRHDSSTMGSNSNSTSQSTANSTPSPQSSPPLTGNNSGIIGSSGGSGNTKGALRNVANMHHHLTSALSGNGAGNNNALATSGGLHLSGSNSSTYQAAESINLSLHSSQSLADHHHLNHLQSQLHHFQSTTQQQQQQQATNNQQQIDSMEQHSPSDQQLQQQLQVQPGQVQVQRSSTTSSQEGLIYANLDFHDHQDPSMIHVVGQNQHQHQLMSSPQSSSYTEANSMVSQQQQQQQGQAILLDSSTDNGLALHNHHLHHHNSQGISYNGLSVTTPAYMISSPPSDHHQHSPPNHNHSSGSSSIAQQQLQTAPNSVGATVAMMNSQIQQQQQQQQQVSGGSVQSAAAAAGNNNQQPVRKPGPPKPPKPTIHQRSKFYDRQVAAAGGPGAGLIMLANQQQQPGNNQNMTAEQQQANIGQGGSAAYNNQNGQAMDNSDMSIEYARIAFPASAEL